ncbi:MAG: cell division protein CrgA [Actinomycetes bacterium]|tara:strand:+ start:375 stop:632 length:258 start_codon:yes stop_codon:yes gene_type:complete
MPKSPIRKKDKAYVPEAVSHAKAAPTESPKWLVPAMVAAFISGLIWIVIFYVSATAYPIPDIGAWNMVIGFSFIAVGFSLATRWR